MRRSIILLSAAAAVLAAAPSALAGIVINGDFENVGGFGGTGGYYNVGATGADHAVPAGFGWSVPVNNVDVINHGAYGGALTGGGQYGLDLVGYGSTGEISQSFHLTPGAYDLKFDYRAPYIGGAGAQVTLGSLSTTVIGGGAWQTYDAALIAGGLSTLSFLSTGGGGNSGLYLDNISITHLAHLPAPYGPGGGSASNLVLNGGFENVASFGGTGSYYNIGGPGSDHSVPPDFGWTVPVNNVDIINHGAFGGALGDGQTYGLDLVGYGATGAISQTVPTLAGHAYRLSFEYESPYVGGAGADVTFGGHTFAVTGGGPGWKTYSGEFAATGASPLSFLSTGGSGNSGLYLDNITVIGVPEPAAWLLMLVGVGVLGGGLRSVGRIKSRARVQDFAR